MQPRLSIIAASIRRILTSGFVEPTSDPYWDNTVLSLRMESSDPYYNQKVLGLHCDGTNGSTTITDVKGKTATRAGNVQISTAQYPPLTGKTSSLYFDGTGDYVTYANSSDWEFGSGDFTVKLWCRPASAALDWLIHRGTATGYTAWSIAWNGTTGKFGVDGSITGSSYAWAINSTSTYSVNTWHLIEFVRSGTSIYLFVDGALEGSATGVSGSLMAESGTMKIGADNGNVYQYTGYMSEIEIYKGVALHTKNYIVSSDPFPEPANTAIDDKGKAVTSYGNAQYSGVSKYGTGSFYFDGTGDYLSVPDSTDWSFGTADFTVEAWVRFDSSNPAVQTICSQFNTSSNWWFLRKEDNTTNKLSLYFRIGGTVKASYIMTNSWSSWAADTWYHIAMVRSGSSMYLFINGVSQALTATVAVTTNDMGDVASSLYIGSDTTYALKGYIDDLRITKGVARYTANFTPYKILTSAPAGDPYYNYTALLLKMDGTNGGTSFTDNSYSAKTVSVFGNSNTSTAAFKYGTAAGYFDGTGDYLTTPYNAGFDPSGDFTCECWIYSTNVTSLRSIVGPYTQVTNTLGWLFYQSSLGALALIIRDSGGAEQTVASADGLIQLNVWHHVTWTRTGTTYRLFIDGAVVATATATVTLYVHPSHPLIVGRWDDVGTNTRDWQGYIDDLRITNGVARYTSTFPPPGPHIANTDPDTDQWWLNTVLALRMDGTHGSTIFTDLKGKTVTPYGNASISSAVSKFGQAAYFDGTGDYLTLDGSSDFAFGTGDFTVEMWVRPTAVNADYILYDSRPASTQGIYPVLYLTSTATIDLFVNSTTVITGAHGITAETWAHVTCCRSSGVTKIFVNGVQKGSNYTDTNNYLIGTSRPSIGTSGYTLNTVVLNGYIDDLRVTKGVARYTAAFTPSEKPLPTYVVGPDHDQYWDKVVLAAPFDSSLICARNKTMTAGGSAAISSTQKKFGAASLYLNGTTSYLTTTDYDDLDIGTITTSTDWTFECWIYATNAATVGYVASHAVPGSGGTGRGGWSVYVVANKLYVDFANNVTGASNLFCFNSSDVNVIENNVWCHIAVVLSDGLLSMFANGIKIPFTANSSSGYYQATPIGLITTKLNWGIEIGRSPPDSLNPAGGYLAGYIDDLRITKDVARYTANFEPPTKANILG